MSDIVERLRIEGENAMPRPVSLGTLFLCADAADEIERLRHREAELLGALKDCAEELSVELAARYPKEHRKIPRVSIDYTHAMQPVFRARALLRAVKERDA